MEFIALVVIAVIAFMIKQINAAGQKNKQSARSNKAQQRMQGFTTPPGNQPGRQPAQLPAQPVPPDQVGQYKVPGQVIGLFDALRSKGQFPPPGQPVRPPVSQSPQPGQYQQTGQYQHRPPQNNLPAPKGDVDTRVRELLAAHNEVGAVRLLCDEQDMGIIEAQKYARGLVLRQGTPRAARRTEDSGTTDSPVADAGPVEESRYVGSAAFAESVFSTDPDENVWASGWVDKPEQDDRTDMDELWQTVRNAGAPKPS
jgi:hypothetical protein